MSKLSIIIPCFHNEGSIPELAQELLDEEPNFPAGTQFEYIFVDDASSDNTWEHLKVLQIALAERVKTLRLRANVGSNNAVLAGLTVATGDCIAVMAADGQDPPQLLPKMYKHWQDGNKLVVAYRETLKTSFMNKLIGNTFHLIMGLLSGTNPPLNGFDMVLFDKSLVKRLEAEMVRNVNLFYCLLWLYKKAPRIPYTKRTRRHGHSMWTFSKKVNYLRKSIAAFLPMGGYASMAKKYVIAESF